MATKKRLIDAMNTVTKISKRVSALIQCGAHPTEVYNVVLDTIAEAPTVDAVEVVRCKDCRYSRLPAVLTQKYGLPGTLTCDNKNSPCNHRNVLGNFFCAYGERKDNGKKKS